jgi:hypothetical protein
MNTYKNNKKLYIIIYRLMRHVSQHGRSVFSTDREATSYPIFRDRPLDWTGPNFGRPLRKNTLPLSLFSMCEVNALDGCESAGDKPKSRVLARAGSDQPDVDIRDSLSRSPSNVPLAGFVLPRITMLISPPRIRSVAKERVAAANCEMQLSIKRQLNCHCRRKDNQPLEDCVSKCFSKRLRNTL